MCFSFSRHDIIVWMLSLQSLAQDSVWEEPTWPCIQKKGTLRLIRFLISYRHISAFSIFSMQIIFSLLFNGSFPISLICFFFNLCCHAQSLHGISSFVSNSYTIFLRSFFRYPNDEKLSPSVGSWNDTLKVISSKWQSSFYSPKLAANALHMLVIKSNPLFTRESRSWGNAVLHLLLFLSSKKNYVWNTLLCFPNDLQKSKSFA